jgi:hypothetical protein
MLHGRDVEAGVQPRVSTGRSIHAVPSITPSPREGIEDEPRLRQRASAKIGRKERPERQPGDAKNRENWTAFPAWRVMHVSNASLSGVKFEAQRLRVRRSAR